MITQKKFIFLGLALVLVLVGAFFAYKGINQKKLIRQSNQSVSFLLSPISMTKNIHETFDVKLSLDSKTLDASGIDMMLTFDKNNLELVRFNPRGAFSDILVNQPNNTNGTFRLLATKSASNNATGVIDVGTLTFRGKSIGTSSVKFQSPLVTAARQKQYIPTANNSIGQYVIKGAL